MSNTLVIHLDDRSTDFLKYIYEGKGYDIINDGNIPDEELREAIKTHDRIIMLGHGLPQGLINVNRGIFNRNTFFINDSHANLLREKETISMWCFSDQYFRRNHIEGFHTGMIISEVSEEYMALGFAPLSKEELLENNIKMAKVLGNCIELSKYYMRDYMLANYIGDDQVTAFNRRNMIVL